MAFEIWRYRETGARYLVNGCFGAAQIAARPLEPDEDPVSVLIVVSTPREGRRLWSDRGVAMTR